MSSKVKTPRAHQYETQMRGAFRRALTDSTKHTQLTGRVYNKLSTTKGLHNT